MTSLFASCFTTRASVSFCSALFDITRRWMPIPQSVFVPQIAQNKEMLNFFSIYPRLLTRDQIDFTLENHFPCYILYKQLINDALIFSSSEISVLDRMIIYYLENPYDLKRIANYIEEKGVDEGLVDELFPLEAEYKAFFPSKEFFVFLLRVHQTLKIQSIAEKIIVTFPTISPVDYPKIGSYEELTRRIKQDALDKIEVFCASNSGKLSEIIGLIQINYNQSSTIELENLFNSYDRKWLWMASFWGFKKGILSLEVLLRSSSIAGLGDIPVSIIDPIGSDGLISSKAENILSVGFNNHLNLMQKIEFIKYIEQLPKEKRLIVYYPTKQNYLNIKDFIATPNQNIFSVGEQILNKQRINLFNMFIQDNRYQRMIVSIEFYQTLFKSQFPESCVNPNPVFGISKPYQIKVNGITATRDICYPHVEISSNDELKVVLNEEADTFKCIEGDFTYHDEYHALVSSAIPNHIKLLYISISEFLEDLANQNRSIIEKENCIALKKMSWIFKDMDFITYLYSNMYQINPNEPVFQSVFSKPNSIHLEIEDLNIFNSLFRLFYNFIASQIGKFQIDAIEKFSIKISSEKKRIDLENIKKLLSSYHPFSKSHIIFELINLIFNFCFRDIKNKKSIARYLKRELIEAFSPELTKRLNVLSDQLKLAIDSNMIEFFKYQRDRLIELKNLINDFDILIDEI